MSDRYTAMNMDTHGEVWDRHQQRMVSRHALIRDAEVEAARLNAEAPRRAAAVEAWARVSHGEIRAASVHWSKEEAAKDASAFLGDRIARVRIEEIDE
jgi:hypothetical protein